MKTIAIDVTANSTKYIIKQKEMPIPREIYQLSQSIIHNCMSFMTQP